MFASMNARLARTVVVGGMVAMGAAGCADMSATGPSEKAGDAGAVVPSFQSSGFAGRVIAGGPFNLRAGPGTSYAVVGQVRGGTSVTIVCQAYGSTVTGPWGPTTIWDKLPSGAWITDAYVYTGRNGLVAPLCSQPGSSIAPGVRGDNYPYRTDPRVFNPRGCSADIWNFCKRNCTSFVAHRLNGVNRIPFTNQYRTSRWGHAYEWAPKARALGFAVDRTPRVGSVAYWNRSTSRPVGHVAWVAEVSADGRTVVLEEYNFDNRGNYRWQRVSTSSVDGFIHMR